MTDNRVERRLAAILAADVAGYSRLTGLDEEGTYVRLRERLRGLADPKISEHRGKVVKHTGDGVLAEFGSVVDAVRCAIEVQRGMAEQNAAIPQTSGSNFASASMSATSSSMTTISLVTASTLPLALKGLRSRAAFASLTTHNVRSAGRSISPLRIWVRRT